MEKKEKEKKKKFLEARPFWIDQISILGALSDVFDARSSTGESA